MEMSVQRIWTGELILWHVEEEQLRLRMVTL